MHNVTCKPFRRLPKTAVQPNQFLLIFKVITRGKAELVTACDVLITELVHYCKVSVSKCCVSKCCVSKTKTTLSENPERSVAAGNRKEPGCTIRGGK